MFSRIKDIIQEIVSVPVFIQFLSSSTSQILAAYNIFNAETTYNTCRESINMAAITFETFVPCYYGDLLEDAGDDLSKFIYECNWEEQSIKFKKMLLIMLIRSQRKNNLEALGYFSITLLTFLKVTMIIKALIFINIYIFCSRLKNQFIRL